MTTDSNWTSLADMGRSLSAKLGELTKAVAALTAGLATHKRKTQIKTRFLAALLAVDFALSILVTYGLWVQYQTRVASLCPLYSVIVGAYAPETRKAGAERDAYVSGYQVINQAYDNLGCPLPPLPPRVAGAPPTPK